jgi:hypothetical protein
MRTLRLIAVAVLAAIPLWFIALLTIAIEFGHEPHPMAGHPGWPEVDKCGYFASHPGCAEAQAASLGFPLLLPIGVLCLAISVMVIRCSIRDVRDIHRRHAANP